MTKIKKIQIQNIKAIKDFSFDVLGENILIVGQNRQGKSTFANFLFEYFNNERPPKILHNDTGEGFYKIEMTDGCAFHFFVEKDMQGNELKKVAFIDAEGEVFEHSKTVKAFIEKYFVNKFTLKNYLQATPAEKAKMFETLFGEEFSNIVKLEKQYYEDRKQVKSQYNKDNLSLENKTFYHGLTDDLIDVSQLRQDLADAKASAKMLQETKAAKETSINRLRESVLSKIYQRIDIEIEIEKLTLKLQKLNSEIDTDESIFENEIADYKDQFGNGNGNSNTTNQAIILDLEMQIAEAEVTNGKIAKNKEYKNCEADLQSSYHLVEIAEQNLQTVRNAKMDLIKSLNLPSDFGFTEEGELTYNGLVLNENQQSTSEKIICGIQLSLLGCGLLRVVHFEKSLIDYKNFELIMQMAKEMDFQVFAELPAQKEQKGLQIEFIEH